MNILYFMLPQYILHEITARVSNIGPSSLCYRSGFFFFFFWGGGVGVALLYCQLVFYEFAANI